jgi:hypothetical protein
VGDPIRDGDFWRGPMEAALYLEIVRRNPKREDETTFGYIVRLADAVRAEQAADGELRRKAAETLREQPDQRDASNW